MSSREPGDVVLVEVPFTDLSQRFVPPSICSVAPGGRRTHVFVTHKG